MNMVGDMRQYTQFQVGAVDADRRGEPGGGAAGIGAGLGAGMAMGQGDGRRDVRRDGAGTRRSRTPAPAPSAETKFCIGVRQADSRGARSSAPSAARNRRDRRRVGHRGARDVIRRRSTDSSVVARSVDGIVGDCRSTSSASRSGTRFRARAASRDCACSRNRTSRCHTFPEHASLCLNMFCCRPRARMGCRGATPARRRRERRRGDANRAHLRRAVRPPHPHVTPANRDLSELRRRDRVPLVGRGADVVPRCHSVLVRHDLDLEKVGAVGDVPLVDVAASSSAPKGSYKDKPFVVVGRIVYEYERGHWNEWHIRVRRRHERVAVRRADASMRSRAGSNAGAAAGTGRRASRASGHAGTARVYA